MNTEQKKNPGKSANRSKNCLLPLWLALPFVAIAVALAIAFGPRLRDLIHVCLKLVVIA